MTEYIIDQTEDQEPGVNDVLWVSETPWPEGSPATAWAYKHWSLAPIDAWSLTDELDAISIPWRALEPDSADPIFYTPAGDVVAEMVMTDAGLFKPFSFFEEGAQ